MKRRIVSSLWFVLLAGVALPAHSHAAALALRWSQGPAEQISRWTQQVADFDGDGQLETVLIESPSGKLNGKLTIRDMLSGRIEFQSDSLGVGLGTVEMELVDVDADGLQDVVLFGDVSMSPYVANYLMFGFGGFYRLKDFAWFASTGAGAPHLFAQLYPDPALEMVVPKITMGGSVLGFQVHVFGQPQPWFDETIPGATVNISLYAFDANSNGLDELYIKCNRTLYMYAHDDAVAGVQGVPPAAAARLALAAPFPNPSRGSTALRFTLPAKAQVTLRVIDAAGRQARQIEPGLLEPGEHTISWDACDDSGRRLSPGVYWLDVEANGERGVRKVVQLR